jgi:hypothetical protein
MVQNQKIEGGVVSSQKGKAPYRARLHLLLRDHQNKGCWQYALGFNPVLCAVRVDILVEIVCYAPNKRIQPTPRARFSLEFLGVQGVAWGVDA